MQRPYIILTKVPLHLSGMPSKRKVFDDITRSIPEYYSLSGVD